MQLAVFNGSPRGKKSNTKILLEHFQTGFKENKGEITSLDYLIKENDLIEQVQRFKSAQIIFMAFPLYVDSVPGIVKQFIESIGNFDGTGKRILFLVQSGFPEAIHSEGVKNYLQLLAKRWNMKCLGVIVKPGVEGIQIMPESMTKRLFAKMELFGSQLAKTTTINAAEVEKLAKPYKFSKSRMMMFKMMQLTGITNFYWNKKLKEHDAFEHRFDAPLFIKNGAI